METAAVMTQEEKESQVRDSLRWVAQEAKALKNLGVLLPKGSRLREALEALETAYGITTV